MAQPVEDSPSQLAFLSVISCEKNGYVGGLLVLNRYGRPLEFHCTAPLRANRAQEILYGNTLAPFLCGEQITPALLARTSLPLLAVITDSPEVLTAEPGAVPLVFLFPTPTGDSPDNASPQAMVQSLPFVPGLDFSARSLVRRARRALAFPSGWADQKENMQSFDLFLQSIDPAEPFERIRLAIEEAQRGT